MSVGVQSGSAEADGAYASSRHQHTKGISINVESIRLHAASMMASLQSRISMDTLRPLPVFLGVDPVGGLCFAGGAFTPPVKKVDKASFEKIKSRVVLNLNFFLSNYALVTAMVALVVSLMHPGMLLFVALVYGLWTLHSFLIRNEMVLFGLQLHSLLSVQQRFYVLFVLTAVVIVFKCLKPALIFVSIAGILTLLHALLRDPKHIEYTNDLLLNQSEDEYDEGEGEALGSDTRRGDVI